MNPQTKQIELEIPNVMPDCFHINGFMIKVIGKLNLCDFCKKL